jgi:hypothetical protein
LYKQDFLPSTSGTVIGVNSTDLPVSITDDLSATISFADASETFAEIVSLLQRDSSTLTSGEAHLLVRAPKIPKA